jgi:NlpC/P60 family putative phage cell wall peptidase
MQTPLTRAALVAEARSWIGTPYRHQASLKGVGCDCLGLVRGVWRVCIGNEPEEPPPYAPDWAEACGEERLVDAAMRHLEPRDRAAYRGGDVLLFRWSAWSMAKHAAIATGEGTMIHAHDGAKVCEVKIVPFWQRKLACAFAFPGVSE